MKKKLNLATIILAVGFVLCTAASVIVTALFTDMETGFLYREYQVLGYLLLYGLSAVFAVSMIFAVKADQKKGWDNSTVSGGDTAVLGVLMLVLALTAFIEGINEFSAFTPSLFLEIIDFAGAIYMAIVGFVTLSSKQMKPGTGFAYSGAALYFVLRGMCLMRSRMAILTIPSYLTEILANVAAALMFSMVAKILSGNGEKNTKPAVCFWGAATVALNLSSGIGIMLSKLLSSADVAGKITASLYTAEEHFEETQGDFMMTFMPWVNIAVGVLAAAFVLMICIGRKEKTSASADASSDNTEEI